MFPTPPQLEPAIQFWTGIFSRYESNTVLLHDREDLAVVWQVVELPQKEDGSVDPKLARETVDSARSELSARLKRLSEDATPKDDRDTALLAVAGASETDRLRGARHWLPSSFSQPL